MNSNQDFEAIQSSSLFHKIPWQEVKRLLTAAGYRQSAYQKGGVIALEEDECSAIGIVVSGVIQLQKTQPSGRAVILDTLRKGEIFGEVVVFSTMRLYPASILAVTDSRIIFIDRKGIKLLCKEDETFLENFLRSLSTKILTLNRKVRFLSYNSIREQVTALLLEEYKKEKKLTITLPFATRNEAAEFLALPRPSLSRELAAMKREGLINYHKNLVSIIDLKRLEEGMK